jgi:hypothetical protein
MLHRPPAADRRRAQRQRRRLAQREYRRRLDAGRFKVSPEIDGDVVELLIVSKWLPASDRDDRKKIAKALSAMLSEAAKR